MKIKLNGLLNIIIGSSIGVFIGHLLFNYIHYRNHPEWYAMQSAPWYTSSMVYGTVSVFILLIAVLLKILIIKKDHN